MNEIQRGGRATVWIVGFLSLLPWWVSTRGPYHFDDLTTPVDDPASQSLAAWWAHLTVTLRPLSKLGFALESSAGWGQEPSLRRVDSALILAFAAMVLFALLVRLGAGKVSAFFLSVAYAAHPIHAEEVLALAGRSAEMASLGIFASLLLLVKRRDRASALVFLLSCFSRETAVLGLLPMAALVASRPGGWRAALGRLEWHVTAAFAFGIYLVWHHRYGELADYSIHARPYLATIIRQVAAVPVGMSLWVRPAALSIDHGEALPSGWWSLQLFAGALILVGLGLVCIRLTVLASREINRARRRDLRLHVVGAALVLAALLPTQSLFPKLDALTERPFAFALAGALMLGAPMARRALSKHVMVWLVAASLTLLLGFATVARGKLYASDLALWGDAAKKSETNPRPHFNYALALLDAHDDGRARAEIEKAMELDPFDMQIRGLYGRLVDRHVQNQDP